MELEEEGFTPSRTPHGRSPVVAAVVRNRNTRESFYGAVIPTVPQAFAQETVVLVVQVPVPCGECGALRVRGDLVHYEGTKPLCLDCALLGRLVLLPSGDVALTRRASTHSKMRAIVLEWSARRKRYERRGTLVEPDAIRRARAECDGDAHTREAQRARAAVRRDAEEREYIAAFTEAVRGLFPGCPLSEAREIAAHACEKYSGRVGRTADAKQLDPEKVRLAVIAHVRHLHTSYDQIIARTRDKRGSRARIKGDVTSVLREWSAGALVAPPTHGEREGPITRRV